VDARCSISRLSVREAVTRALPLLLAGIGLSLAFGYHLFIGLMVIVAECGVVVF
jgi:hypothetical protein